MSDAYTFLREPKAEKTQYTYRTVLKNDVGVAIGPADLTALQGTLFDQDTGAIINSFDTVGILNTDRGTLDASGNLAITLRPADMVILNAALAYETHILKIRLTFGATGERNHSVGFRVENMSRVA